MKTQRKEMYVAPAIEIIKMEVEATVMAGSGLPGVDDGGNGFGTTSSSSARRTYGGASSSELEDLINDILTIEQ